MTQANGLDWHWAKGSPSLKLIDFAFLKAFQGLSYGHEDWFYPEQTRVRNAGLAAVGWYHFGQGAQSPTTQADLFLARCQPRPGEWLWLDWEWVPQPPGGNGVNMTTAQAAAWHQRVAQRFPNNPRGTYTSKNFLGGRSTRVVGEPRRNTLMPRHGLGCGHVRDPGPAERPLPIQPQPLSRKGLAPGEE